MGDMPFANVIKSVLGKITTTLSQNNNNLALIGSYLNSI